MTEHAVKLDSLPAGLEFPPELANRIHFDPAKHRLVYRGFMYKAHYDRLMRLDSSVEYRRAIMRLFQCSTDAESPQLRRFGWIIATLVAACLLLAGFVWWQLMRPTPGFAPAPRSSAAEEVRVVQFSKLDHGLSAGPFEVRNPSHAVVRAHEEAFRRMSAEARQR